MAPRRPHPDPPTGPCLAEEDYYEDDEEDDPDALKDPLYQIDLQVSPPPGAARRGRWVQPLRSREGSGPASSAGGLGVARCCRAAWSRALLAWGLAPPVCDLVTSQRPRHSVMCVSPWPSVSRLNPNQTHRSRELALGVPCPRPLGVLVPVPVGDAALPLQAYLTDFLCQFAQQPCYPAFSGHLNDSERRVLQTIGV